MIRPVLYTQTGCVDSARVRTWLQQRGICFVERDVTTDPVAAAELARYGVFATPLLVIGEHHIFSFQPEKLKAALDEAR